MVGVKNGEIKSTSVGAAVTSATAATTKPTATLKKAVTILQVKYIFPLIQFSLTRKKSCWGY